MIRRTVGTALSMCLILTAAALDLGTPDFRSAAGFFTDAIPTMAAAEATMALLVWVMVAGICAVLLAGLIRAVRREAWATHARARLCLVAGVLLVGAAVVHRAIPTDAMCCGASPSEVQEAVHLAR